MNTRTTLKAVKINPLGQVYDNFEFGFGPQTEVWESCSVIINNTMVVFGGANHETQVFELKILVKNFQISRVEGCRLVRQGDLPFNLKNGACTRYDIYNGPGNDNDRRVMLCFDRTDGKRCYGYFSI